MVAKMFQKQLFSTKEVQKQFFEQYLVGARAVGISHHDLRIFIVCLFILASIFLFFSVLCQGGGGAGGQELKKRESQLVSVANHDDNSSVARCCSQKANENSIF